MSPTTAMDNPLGAPVSITGISIVTAAGSGAAALRDSLDRGECFVQSRPGEPWPDARFDLNEFAPWPNEPVWADQKKYASQAAQLAVWVARAAIVDAALAAGSFDPWRSGIVLSLVQDATEWEAITKVAAERDDRPPALRIYDELVDFHALRAIPTQASQLVARAAGFSGSSVVVTRPLLGGLTALAEGLWLLETGEVDRVLVVGASPLMSPMEVVGAHRCVPLATAGADGSVAGSVAGPGRSLGMGAAAILLERSDCTDGRTSHAELLSCETRAAADRADATSAAIEGAIKAAGVVPAAVFAHQNGSPTLDAMEASAIAAHYPGALATTKPTIGELFACGGLVDIALAAHGSAPASNTLVSALSMDGRGGAAAAMIGRRSP